MVAEVALACAVLVASALLVRSVKRMMTGADRRRRATASSPRRLQLEGAEVSAMAERRAVLRDPARSRAAAARHRGGRCSPTRCVLQPGWRIPFDVDGRPAPRAGRGADRAARHGQHRLLRGVPRPAAARPLLRRRRHRHGRAGHRRQRDAREAALSGGGRGRAADRLDRPADRSARPQPDVHLARDPRACRSASSAWWATFTRRRSARRPSRSSTTRSGSSRSAR